MNAMGIAAASGIRARMESLDLLSNNLANSSTSGYKAAREWYSTYWSAESTASVDQGARGSGASPEIRRHWTDFGQGALRQTGAANHIAFSGPGFLAVSAAGVERYTRNGELAVGAAGTLRTLDGHDVLSQEGKPLELDANLPLEIRADGSIWQAGAAAGQLRLVEFPEPQALERLGGSLFGTPDGGSGPVAAKSTTVQQGALEMANGGQNEGAVRMVHVLRQFEALQRAMQLDSDMSRQLIEEVAKP